MARQDGAELVAEAGERLVDRHAGAARIGEDHIDAVVDQGLDQDIGPAGQFVLRLGLGDSRHGITSMRVWKGECGVPSLGQTHRRGEVRGRERP